MHIELQNSFVVKDSVSAKEFHDQLYKIREKKWTLEASPEGQALSAMQHKVEKHGQVEKCRCAPSYGGLWSVYESPITQWHKGYILRAGLHIADDVPEHMAKDTIDALLKVWNAFCPEQDKMNSLIIPYENTNAWTYTIKD